MIALCIGCQNQETPPENSITQEQRDAAIESAEEHLNAGNLNKALAITTQLVSKDDTSSLSLELHALVLLALADLSQGDGALQKAQAERLKSLDAFQQACRCSTQPGLLELSTGKVAQMVGEDEIAKEYYEKAHLNVEDDGRAAFFLAQIEMLNANWQDAKIWLVKSNTRDPYEPYTLLSLALVEAQLGNHALANSLADDGCDILPNNMDLRFIQARVFRLTNQPIRAIEILNALPDSILNSKLGQEEMNLCKSMLIEGDS